MAILIKPDGNEEKLQFTTLPYLQKAVCGYIECVKIEDGRFVVFNEDYLVKNLPINQKATDICSFEVFGNAVICTKEELN
jgi:hypothetical protein